MLSGNAAVIGAESVDHDFELRRHSIVIKRCCEDDHISVQDRRPYFLIIVMQDAGAFISACYAPGTRTDVHICKIEPDDTVSCLFRSPGEILN